MDKAMCRQLMLLARNNIGQMIFTCEHGTMHITHQHTTVCLAHIEFVCFAQWITEGGPLLPDANSWRVQDSTDGHMEIWVGSGGLRLRASEFSGLIELLRGTLQRLKTLDWEQMRPATQRYSPAQHFSQN
jgi:hypothetical protein